MNYYYVNRFDVEAENEEEAILKAKERDISRGEMISHYMIFDDETDMIMISVKYLDYHKAIVLAYMELKHMNIDINKIRMRGSKYIDFTGDENEDKKVFNEFSIEDTDDVKKYISNYLKKNYSNTDYLERYSHPYEYEIKRLNKSIADSEKKGDDK